ncbi:hypothetical protein OK074_6128 [Actinobacteria bacterium OK074]|nr:hypothetical protein OK074_6128 [Actinobacteria bacterium OK074]
MNRTLVTRSPRTPADWWVTADQARHAAQDGLAGATTAPDLLRTLAELDRARRAAAVSVGAAVEALLASGADWTDIAAAVGSGSAEDARETLTTARRDAEAALERRLGHRDR